jgi:mRNA interferase RelE/StbE
LSITRKKKTGVLPNLGSTIRSLPSAPVSFGKSLAWIVEYDPRAEKDLRKLDRDIQREILDYLDGRIATNENPRRFGKALRHGKRGLWRYRIQDYRIVCEIQDTKRVVLVVAVGHRSIVYE